MMPYDQELEELMDWIYQNYPLNEICQFSHTLMEIHRLPVAYGCPND